MNMYNAQKWSDGNAFLSYDQSIELSIFTMATSQYRTNAGLC